MTVIPMPGAEIERHAGTLQLSEYVTDAGLDQIARALPDGVSLAKFDTALATAMLTLPELKKTDRTSLFLALVRCASRGLLPDGVEAAIVPFNNRKKGIVEATFIEMIRGTRRRFAQHGWLLTASVVRAADTFTIDKGDGRITHNPTLTGDPGAVIGAWAKATHRDGRRRAADYMTIEQINALAQQMNVSERELWKKWPDQAAEKTVAHRLANDIGLADEDRERSEIITATELDPEDQAAALYGEGARATFSELPSGVTPASPAAEGDPVEVDQHPPVDASSQSSGVASVEGDPNPSDEPGAAAPIDDDEPLVVLDPEPDEAAVKARAEAAAMFIPPNGQFSQGGELGPKSLSEILALGEQGEKWLRWALGKVTGPEEYVDSVWAFTAFYAPALYEAAAKRKAA